jgi:hypothetical protein
MSSFSCIFERATFILDIILDISNVQKSKIPRNLFKKYDTTIVLFL